MPLIRRIIQVGNAKAVTIPKGWLDFWEDKLDGPVSKVAVEINHEMKILPFEEKKGGRKHNENP